MGRKNIKFSQPVLVLKNHYGMTLTEVLVVLAILAIFILLTIFSLRPTLLLGRARDSRRRADLKKIATGFEDYSGDHGSYPCPGVWESKVQFYLSPVPKDPLTKQSYIYSCPGEGCVNNGCTAYIITAALEIDEGANYGSGIYAVASSNYRLVEPTSTPAPPFGRVTSTPAPTSPPGGNFWACFSPGVCQPIADPSVCPNINYQIPDCGDKCSDSTNWCH